MSITVEAIIEELKRVQLPDGSNIVDADMVRAVTINDGKVNFVLEVPGDIGERMEPVRSGAEALILRMDGVDQCNVMMTAHSAPKQPPNLKIEVMQNLKTINSQLMGLKNYSNWFRKGGVGKSTVSSNLAVALSKLGLKVGLLDADIHGPSQPRMMGVSKRPASPDGKTIIPLQAHGVTMMSLGLMLKEDEAVIWRGPMLMGALQQMLNQVQWGQLDVLLIDLPPGTGDVQLTLSQKTEVSGAIIVSTPQDVALLDARKAINMFERMEVPIIGMIENMSSYHCPKCGHEEYIFWAWRGARRC